MLKLFLMLVAGGVAFSPGNGAWSRDLTAPAFAPGRVSDLRVSAVTDTSAVLTWTEVSTGGTGIAKYAVRFGDLATYGWPNVADVTTGGCGAPVYGSTAGGGRTRSCVLGGLASNRSFRFQVIAYTGVLNTTAVFGPLSNIAEGRTAQRQGPLVVTGGPEAGDSVFLETLRASGYSGWTGGRYPIRGWAPLGLTTLTGYVGDSVVVRGYLFVVRP